MGEIEGETPCLALGDGEQTPSKCLTLSLSLLHSYPISLQTFSQCERVDNLLYNVQRILHPDLMSIPPGIYLDTSF